MGTRAYYLIFFNEAFMFATIADHDRALEFLALLGNINTLTRCFVSHKS